MSENKHTPEPVESCDTCKNNGGTRGECQNESCAYEPKTKPLEVELAALRKQRDELLAALGSGGRHCNDDTPHSDLCEAIIDSKEADLGQGLDPFWKWAFRRGFHEAETSYKVDIATLEQQRDELLAALEPDAAERIATEAFLIGANGGHMADLYKMPERIKLRAAIASVKGGA